MTVQEFVTNVVVRSEGKLPSFSSGQPKWLRIVAIGNYFLRQFAREKGVDWARYYNPALTIDTVTATDTFALPNTVRKVSRRKGDHIRITHADSVSYTNYSLVPHDKLKSYSSGNYVAKIGSNLVFNQPFTADSPQFGGTITCPVYRYPTPFSDSDDEIDIDEADWLVCVTAGDRVKNDVTRKDLRADLIAEANEIMATLKENQLTHEEEADRPWNPIGHIGEEW